jgi:hypothetical protein
MLQEMTNLSLETLLLCLFVYPPIITVKHPNTIDPPCAVESPKRAAGIPPINTVADPFTIESGGPTQTNMSPTRAAGNFPIKTVGSPGPIIGPPTCGIGGSAGVTIGHS